MRTALPSLGEALRYGLHRYQERARHILRVQAAKRVQREHHLL
jgi:hypothetical protein